MTEVSARELRNDTAGILRRVSSGEEIIITVRGRPAAQLVPIPSRPRRWIPRTDLIHLLKESSADYGLRAALDELAGDTTDDLGPPE